MGLSLEEAVEKQRQLEHKVTKSSDATDDHRCCFVLMELRTVCDSCVLTLFVLLSCPSGAAASVRGLCGGAVGGAAGPEAL